MNKSITVDSPVFCALRFFPVVRSQRWREVREQSLWRHQFSGNCSFIRLVQTTVGLSDGLVLVLGLWFIPCRGHTGPHINVSLLCQHSSLILPRTTYRFPLSLVLWCQFNCFSVYLASPVCQRPYARCAQTIMISSNFCIIFIFIFYSLKTVVKRNCLQSSYTYRYNQMLWWQMYRHISLICKIASV